MKKIIYALFLLFLIGSCNSIEEGGRFAPVLSLTEYTFGVEGGSLAITVQGGLWTPLSLGFIAGGRHITNRDGVSLEEFLGITGRPLEESDIDRIAGMDITEWGSIETISTEYVSVKRMDWFEVVSNKELLKIMIDVQPNTSGKKRVIAFTVGVVPNDASVKIIQSAE